MKNRVILFIVLILALGTLDVYFNQVYQPEQNKQAALSAANGSSENFRLQNSFASEANLVLDVSYFVVLIMCFWKPTVEYFKLKEKES